MKLLLLILLIQSSINSLEIQKAKNYNNNQNISGWLMSEKLDGIRAYWTGKELLSKNGNKIFAPTWFIKNLPDFKLDGELWTKRDDFENIQNIVLDETPSLDWNKITYNIFEVPNQKGNFLQRLEVIKNWQKQKQIKHLKIIPQIVCKNEEHLNSYLEELVSKKAEGVIIKNPDKEYFTGRSDEILKVKKFYDMEGLVIGHNYNDKKEFKSLKLKLENGVVFNLGGGFSDKQRLNPPKLGQIITFKYYDLTKNGKPKFASFFKSKRK